MNRSGQLKITFFLFSFEIFWLYPLLKFQKQRVNGIGKAHLIMIVLLFRAAVEQK